MGQHSRERELTASYVEDSSPGRRRVGRVRWGIAILLAASIYINYIDRTNISVAATPISEEFAISKTTLGIVFSTFLWSYGLAQIPVGVLLDKIGVKWIQRIAIAIWTGASLLTAVAAGLGLVIISRLVLGIGEAPGIPSAMKATGYWFPRSERGLATAMFSSGGRLSNVVAAPIVGLMAGAFGWRGAFIGSAVLSFVFLVIWWICYKDPEEMRAKGRLSAEEHDYILKGEAQTEEARVTNAWADLKYLFRQRKMWGLSLGLACAGYVSWVLLTWLPGFLQEQTGLSVQASGFYTAIPWIVAGATELFVAGWVLDRFVKRGYDETRVRKTILISGMVIALGVAGAGFTTSAAVATIFLTLGTTGIAVAFSVSNSLPSLIAAEGTVGTVGGTMNFVNIMFGILAPILTGILVDATGSFLAAFVTCGVFLLLGIFFYVVVLGRIEPIPSRPQPVA